MSSFSILEMSLLIRCTAYKYFLPLVFHLVMSLALQKLFSLMWSPLPIFVLAASVFGVKSKKPLPRQSLASVGLRSLSNVAGKHA